MKKVYFITAFLLSGLCTTARQVSYNLALVADEVKKNASVITQLDDRVFEVTDLDRASLSAHRVITAVNEDGKDALVFVMYTSRYSKLDDAEIKVFDAAGKQVNRIKKKDMRTVATGEGLIEDGFITYYEVSATTYPVTVDIKYELKLKGTLSYPSYHILSSGEGVVSSGFTAKVPKDLDLRYKEKNISLKPKVTEEGNYKIYHWSVKNMAPIKYEEGGPESRYPSIILAPNRFDFYGYKGDLTSWQSFGRWIGDLYKGQDELPDDRKDFFREMVKDVPGKNGKIKTIYNYMQQNFRYVSIQLGIGGLRPFSAEFTDQKKYGDCKALSNYLKAALKAVDIKSYIAVINSSYNSEPVDAGFPSNNSFDHVILCVPGEQDTTWLECTSKTADFGVLGTFTENRNALLITENGGVLVPTPVSNAGNNRYIISTRVSLDEDGGGKTNTLFQSSGVFREQMDDMLNQKKDDQKRFIVYGIGFKQPDDFVFAHTNAPEMHSTTLEMLIEKIPDFKAGNKMFINPHLYKMWTRKLPDTENRRLDYYFRFPFEQTDTTIFELPEGYTADALPKEQTLSCPYATYTTRYWHNAQQKTIYATTQLVLKQHRIPASGYTAVKEFFDEVLMDDTQRIVIKKE